MAVHLVPLPPNAVAAAAPLWTPFVARIATRDGADVGVLINNVIGNQVSIALAWDEEQQRALALLGMRFVLKGDKRISELIWLTGEGREIWTPLLADLETYLREHEACDGITAICRPGWSKTLTEHGYRTTHYVVEKELT